MTQSPSPSSDLRARVLAAAKSAPSAPRPVLRRRRAAIVVVAIVAWLAVFAISGGVRSGARPEPFVLTVGASLGALAILVPRWLAGRGRSMVARPAAVQGLALGGAALAWVGLLAVGYALWPETLGLESPKPTPLGCWLMTALFAAGPLAVSGAFAHGAETASPRLTGAAIATSGALFGMLGATLHCPYAGVAHQVLGHALPVLVLALAGALLFPVLAGRSARDE